MYMSTVVCLVCMCEICFEQSLLCVLSVCDCTSGVCLHVLACMYISVVVAELL